MASSSSIGPLAPQLAEIDRAVAWASSSASEDTSRAAVSCISIGGAQQPFKPARAQLAEHLAVDVCSYQMVPGSIPGGRIWLGASVLAQRPGSCHGGAAFGQQAKQVISNRLTKLDEQTDVFLQSDSREV